MVGVLYVLRNMKPPRLIVLITLLYTLAISISIYGFLYLSVFGLWLSISLILFFTAHLLSIPHNSGRIWCSCIAFGLFAYSIYKTIIILGLTDKPVSLQLLPIPCIASLFGIFLLMMTLHTSVCNFFDDIDSSTN